MEKKPKKKTKKDEKGVAENLLEEEIVKHYLETKYFQYSDFSVNLEELILNPLGTGLPICGTPWLLFQEVHTLGGVL